jgi:putative toxin-antitoxin system antitoxin component (TIGR02293 family)
MKKAKAAKPAIYPEIQNNAAMALRVEEGLPVKDVVEFGRQAGFTIDELAQLMRIPPRTYARRVASKSRLKGPESERAVRIMRLFDQAKQVFGTHEATHRWFNSRILALGRKTPLEFAQTEPGAREVENVIGRIEHGVYS